MLLKLNDARYEKSKNLMRMLSSLTRDLVTLSKLQITLAGIQRRG